MASNTERVAKWRRNYEDSLSQLTIASSSLSENDEQISKKHRVVEKAELNAQKAKQVLAKTLAKTPWLKGTGSGCIVLLETVGKGNKRHVHFSSQTRFN